MRVISGKYKGKRINLAKNSRARPTADKVKEAIFSSLYSKGLLEGGAILDLFCGTGSLGIEALSRGAKSCVFVDIDKIAVQQAKDNLETIMGCKSVEENFKHKKEDFQGCNAATEYEVYRADYKKAIEKLRGRRFSVIFIDPPYNHKNQEDIILRILKADILEKGGVIVLEQPVKNSASAALSTSLLKADTKIFGSTSVSFLQKRSLAVFAGSFDPFTLGHFNVVEKVRLGVNKLILAVAEDTGREKVALLKTRVEIAKKSVKGIAGVVVEPFSGRLSNFLKEKGCTTLIRGIRDEKDFSYEEEIAKIYKEEFPEIEIVYALRISAEGLRVGAEQKIAGAIVYIETKNEISASKVRQRLENKEDIKDLVVEKAYSDIIEQYTNK